MKEWKFEREFPKVPACVHQIILETLENLDENRKGKHIRKTKWLILAAALTATFGLTVAAAELFDWNPKAAKTFGEPVKEVQNTLTMEGVAKEQEISVTDNGITVTAVQTMNDENVFYALLLVTAESEIIDGSGYFGNPVPEIITKNPDAFCNVGMSFIDMPIAEPSTQGYYEVYALKNIGEEWQEENITILLENYSYDVFNKPKDELTDFTDCTSELIEGKWELTLPLGAMQTDNTIKITEPVQVVMQGVPVTIEELTLTPLALKITYSLADVEKLHQEVYSSKEDISLQELFLSGFVDKNGKETECGFTASSGRHTSDGKDISLTAEARQSDSRI
ncbi:MAG: DUF4179 domain-containing protein [Roseburia sp.]|nr:DUF4179 domain-containing protein [Roseburia sp.]MCM1242531.1 DUF4179 domain-containing protein [Roseburia sp.]